MSTITLKCRTVTPIFSGNAFQDAEIRPTEIKAAMRFWWRAMQNYTNLNDLKKAEAQIFGGSWKEMDNGVLIEKSKRSAFDIEVLVNSQTSKKGLPDGEGSHIYQQVTSGGTFRYNILNYLCYGRCDFRGNFSKGYIPVNSIFDILLTSSDNNLLEQLKLLIWMAGNLSGVGGKSRNGYGNFHVVNYTPEKCLVDIIRPYLKHPRNCYTGFSGDTLVYTGELHDTWDDALDEIGIIYKTARESMGDRHVGNNRKYIGSPLVVDKNTVSDLERHSKFLFLNVQIENGQYRGVVLLLPYNYLEGASSNIIDSTKIASHQSSYNAVFSTFVSKLNASSLTLLT